LKREKAKLEGKVDETLPKLKIKPPKVSEDGQMKMAFSKPIVVFGNGKMPDGDMLQISVVKGESGARRRLSSEASHVE